jgi:restriction system protein
MKNKPEEKPKIKAIEIQCSDVVSKTMIDSVTIEISPLNSITSLLLQAVVVPGENTKEGQIIEAVTLPWLDIIHHLEKDPNLAFEIPWRVWEEIIAGAYKRAGFDEVTITPRSGDHGRDVIAIKHSIGMIRVIDQVKAYGPDYRVKANDVRALIGILQLDGASKAFLTTTSDFAPGIKSDPLIVPWIPSRLELINGDSLIKKLRELANKDNRGNLEELSGVQRKK